jgi:hypothetical protein
MVLEGIIPNAGVPEQTKQKTVDNLKRTTTDTACPAEKAWQEEQKQTQCSFSTTIIIIN